jgi:cytochrome P450
MSTANLKVGDVDLANPEIFEHAVPYEYFAMLRKEAPITWQPQPEEENGGFWNITRYADIEEIEKNIEVFTSRCDISPMPVPQSTLENTIDHSIIMSDQPRHTFLRQAIMKAFTPKAIKKLEETIQTCAADAMNAIIDKGECDLHDMAAYTPIEVVAEILGVPAHDRQKLFDWANAMFGSSDPELSDPQSNMMGAFQMFSYARRLGMARRSDPGEDVFSMLSAAEENGEQLSDIDLGATFIVLATAGNETTRTQFLQGALLLIEHPEIATQLREDPSLMNNAVEEMLRLTTPAMCFARRATRDHTVNGQLIKEGEKVLMWYVSGNRDESVFEDPDTFNIFRKNANKHLSFGSNGAIHRCLGANLARTELRAMLQQLVNRLPDLQLAGNVDRLRSNFTNGIKRMPVKFSKGQPTADASHVKMYASGYEEALKKGSEAAEPEVVLQGVEGHDIQLVHLARVELQLGVPAIIPEGPRGTRLMVEVTKASWQGARIKAVGAPCPAGDWATVSADGALMIDVRATIETDDGATIFVSYEGRSDYSKGGTAPIIITPKFETSDPRYLWLNKVQAVGRGRSEGMSKLIYEVYEVR